MIKILIADDHAVVRRGIMQILSEEKDIEVLGEASNSDEVLEQLYDQKWDLIILDLIMPGKSGLDTLIQIKQRIPELKVLVLSMHPEEEIAIRVLKSGASGYLKKDSVPEELIKAIRKVNGGGKYISSTLAESIFLAMDKDISRPPHEELSEREFQVLCLIATGNALSDIGKELSLSVKTISTYRTRVMEKLKLKTNIELTHYAIKHKLIVSV
jgi:two-component system, NarL family, invasion response regulator UvrY